MCVFVPVCFVIKVLIGGRKRPIGHTLPLMQCFLFHGAPHPTTPHPVSRPPPPTSRVSNLSGFFVDGFKHGFRLEWVIVVRSGLVVWTGNMDVSGLSWVDLGF